MKNECIDCGFILDSWHTAECYAFYCPNNHCPRYGLLTATGIKKKPRKPLTKKQAEVMALAKPYLRLNDLVKKMRIKPSTAEARIYSLIIKGYLVREEYGLYKSLEVEE